MVFLVILGGTSLAMLWQLGSSILKLQRCLTGTSVEYMDANPNLNISISVCVRCNSWPVITPTENYFMAYKREHEDEPWIYDKDVSDVYTWQAKSKVVYTCRSINFKEREVKIFHKSGENSDDVIFLHSPGMVTTNTPLKLMQTDFAKSNILLLKSKQIQVIEEENSCSNSIEFDSCRDEFIAEEFNNTFGCIYPFLK